MIITTKYSTTKIAHYNRFNGWLILLFDAKFDPKYGAIECGHRETHLIADPQFPTIRETFLCLRPRSSEYWLFVPWVSRRRSPRRRERSTRVRGPVEIEIGRHFCYVRRNCEIRRFVRRERVLSRRSGLQLLLGRGRRARG
jgi:hypothetical protein